MPWKLPWKTQLSLNARSELAKPKSPMSAGLLKPGGRGVCETSVRLLIASFASTMWAPSSPTRGSLLPAPSPCAAAGAASTPAANATGSASVVHRVPLRQVIESSIRSPLVWVRMSRSMMGLVRRRGEHPLHPLDLGTLVRVDVGRELEDLGRLRRARGVEEVGDHRQRALVMADHSLEEQPLELGPGRPGQGR